jgi:hypothetical protein
MPRLNKKKSATVVSLEARIAELERRQYWLEASHYPYIAGRGERMPEIIPFAHQRPEDMLRFMQEELTRRQARRT